MKPAHRLVNTYAILFGIVALALAVSIGFGYVKLSHAASTSAADALETAQLHQCEATNVTHASDNWNHLEDYASDLASYRSDLASYWYDAQQVRFTKASLQSNYRALAKLHIDRRVLRRALAQSEAGLASQRTAAISQKTAAASQLSAANAKTWVALTDCTATHSAGEVEVFSIGQAGPPWYALGRTADQLANAAKPDPVGSIP